MGTPNDQAVLQAIFNPDTPFGDIVGLDLGGEAEKEVEGECLTLEFNSLHWLVCRPPWGGRGNGLFLGGGGIFQNLLFVPCPLGSD